MRAWLRKGGTEKRKHRIKESRMKRYKEQTESMNERKMGRMNEKLRLKEIEKE